MEHRNYFIAVFFLLSVLLVLSGCASKHSVKIKDNEVLLYFKQPDAREVIFASNRDLFQYHRARNDNGGVWVYSMPKNEEFVYFYIVDGQVTVPDCENTVKDDFGSRNCVYVPES